jgi:hypothetical protein
MGMGKDIQHYPGTCEVNIVCPVQPAHHRRYIYRDVSIDFNGWAQWTDMSGREHVGFMGLGKCCGMPSIRPLKE